MHLESYFLQLVGVLRSFITGVVASSEVQRLHEDVAEYRREREDDKKLLLELDSALQLARAQVFILN